MSKAKINNTIKLELTKTEIEVIYSSLLCRLSLIDDILKTCSGGNEIDLHLTDIYKKQKDELNKLIVWIKLHV